MAHQGLLWRAFSFRVVLDRLSFLLFFEVVDQNRPTGEA